MNVEWKPIKDCPKDGTPVLGFIPDLTGNNQWSIDKVWFSDGFWQTVYGEMEMEEAPSHFTDLPNCP